MINRLLQPLLRLKLDRNANDLVRGSAVTLFFRLSNFGLGYLFLILITRNFGAETMGYLALAMTVVTIASVVARIGFDTSLVKFVAEQVALNRYDMATAVLHKARNIVLVFGLSVSVGLYFLALPLARSVFEDENLTYHFQLASLAVLPLTLSYLYSAYLQGLGKIREFAFIQKTSVNLFATLSILLLLIFSNAIEVPLVAYLCGVGSTFLVSLYLSGKHRVPACAETPMSMRDMLRISAPLLLASSMGLVMGYADIVMLGMFRSQEEVGVYTVVMKLALITIVMLRAVNGAVAPKFARLYKQNNLAGMQRIARQSTKLIFWASLPALAILLVFPDFVLGLFGKEFVIGHTALVFLTIGMFVAAISGSVGIIMQMTGRQVAFQNVFLVATLLNVFLNFVLIPPFGIEGAAIASMIAIVFRTLALVYYVHATLGFFTIYIPGLAGPLVDQRLAQASPTDTSEKRDGSA